MQIKKQFKITELSANKEIIKKPIRYSKISRPKITELKADRQKKTKIKEFKFSPPKQFSPEQNQEEQERQTNDIRFLESWRTKRATATVPTYNPKNFNEQVVFYKSGSTYRVYFNIDNTWKYITLT